VLLFTATLVLYWHVGAEASAAGLGLGEIQVEGENAGQRGQALRTHFRVCIAPYRASSEYVKAPYCGVDSDSSYLCFTAVQIHLGVFVDPTNFLGSDIPNQLNHSSTTP
jgi:hypothetical protein